MNAHPKQPPPFSGGPLVTLLLPVIGLVLGGLAGGLFGVVCGLLDYAFHGFQGTPDRLLAWAAWFPIGAGAAGMIVGVCAMSDRLVNGRASPGDARGRDDNLHPAGHAGAPPLAPRPNDQEDRSMAREPGHAFCNPAFERMNRGRF
jgi:hypothetical protein